MTPVYIAGRGLISALGADLYAAIATIERGAQVTPTQVEAGAAGKQPCYTIAQDDGDWYARVHELVAQVVAQAGGLQDRNLPLFLASSSLDTGAVENGARPGADCNVLAMRIARALDWQGPVFTVSTACTSSINALRSAACLIRSGAADGALVLSVELASRYTMEGFSGMQLLAPACAQPFGKARDGLVLGEAAVALRLSSRASRWRILGGANIVDGSDPTGAAQQAVVRMCRQVLAASGLDANDIDIVKAHAAGSPANDAVEAAALREVFAALPAFVSLKAVLGHTLAASGAAEIALLTACLESGCLPRNEYLPDDAIGIALANQLPRSVRYVLANILGFGGGHAAIVLEDTHSNTYTNS